MTSRDFQERLVRRARHAAVSLPSGLGERLEAYFRLLATWNQKTNLTALPLADPSAATIDRLLIEPLVAAAHVEPQTRLMLDVGSGGGSPAIPMALTLPQVELRMVESKTRKSVFLLEAIRALQLSAEVCASRMEELSNRDEMRHQHDLVTMRAVRTEPQVLATLDVFVKPAGEIFLFRSTDLRTDELAATRLIYSATHPLTDGGSRLVVLRKSSSSVG